MMAMPFFFRSSMMPKRYSTSFSVSEEVGSSMMMMSALLDTALAISSVWILETDSVFTRALGS